MNEPSKKRGHLTKRSPSGRRRDATLMEQEASKAMPVPQYSEEDQKRIARFRNNTKTSPPKLQIVNEPTKKDGVAHLEPKGDPILHEIAIRETFGTVDGDLARKLLSQACDVTPFKSNPITDDYNNTLALVSGIKPTDELEAMLAVQMVAVHNLSMDFMRRAALQDQTVDGVNTNVERFTKLQRTFVAQMEALNRYRGKGQQKVTVEHVTVNSGGQAIVGSVSQSKAQEGGGG